MKVTLGDLSASASMKICNVYVYCQLFLSTFCNGSLTGLQFLPVVCNIIMDF